MPSNSKFSYNKRRIRPLSSGFLNIFIVLSGNRDSTAEPILFETSLLWKPSNYLFPPTRKLFIYTLASQVKTPWHWEIFIVLCSDGPNFSNCRGIYAACLCHSYSIILLPSQLLYYYTIFSKILTLNFFTIIILDFYLISASILWPFYFCSSVIFLYPILNLT